MSYPNWFAMGAQYYFGQHLLPYAGKEIHCLQIGAYTGDATKWLFEHVLTHPNSTLTDVDTWEGSDEPAHHSMDWKDVETTYNEKNKEYLDSGRLRKKKMTSDEFFKDHPYDSFDFIYVDGDHKAVSVLKDGMNAINALSPHGILAFDDYTWSMHKGPAFDPKPAIDAIRLCYSDQFTTLTMEHQVWLQKN